MKYIEYRSATENVEEAIIEEYKNNMVANPDLIHKYTKVLAQQCPQDLALLLMAKINILFRMENVKI